MGGHLAYKVISSSVKRRMRNLTEDMGTKLSLYIHQIMMKPRGSQTAITAILAPFAFARRPLVNRIGNLNLKITFLYGKYDWMERETAEDLVEKEVVSGCVNSNPEAGHHLYLENPRECVAKILIHIHSAQTSNKFLKSW
jgi:cardiolipin-specific phospholipase